MEPMTTSSSPSSTVYGPVQSWRLGQSLGIDLLFVNSICSFRCVYCQLGKINEHTRERKVFVPTERIMADLHASRWRDADVITFSGSGEPTLALNLGATMQAIQDFTNKPIVVLTNSTLLHDAAVRAELCAADKVFCKLDAATDQTLQLLDRPVAGLTVRGIVDGIKALRRAYHGHLAIQTMLMPINRNEIEQLAMWLKEIQPDEVQLNVPARPVLREWRLEARGNRPATDEPAIKLKLLGSEEVAELAARLRHLTGLPISSVRAVV
ncbi:MAG TPA: radical SAM protein [Blastocatellia bacterium]|nr:radical SAM protein [Blastocatellia bacterium]